MFLKLYNFLQTVAVQVKQMWPDPFLRNRRGMIVTRACFQMWQVYSASVHSCHPMENTVHCMSFDPLPTPFEAQLQDTELALYSYTLIGQQV